MSKTHCVHLLSSAARRQYAEDIIRVLALPRGARLQFRYHHDLTTDSIRNAMQAGTLVGSDCLVSFLHSSDKGVSPELIPCRSGKIIRAGSFGPFIVIVFAVEDFVFSEDWENFTSKLRATQPDIVPSWVSQSGKLELHGKFIFVAPVIKKTISQGYDLGVFAKTVAVLSNHYPFNEEKGAHLNPFFHVSIFNQRSRISERDFSEAALHDSIRLKDGRLLFQSKGSYLIRIHHYYPRSGRYHEKYAKKLVLDFDGLAPQHDDSIEFRITSEYDVNEILFATIASPFRQFRNIAMSLENVTSGATDEGPYADIQLPVTTKPAIAIGLLHSTFLGIGVAAPALIGASFRSEFDIGIAAAIFAGGLVAGLAAVFGFKRGI